MRTRSVLNRYSSGVDFFRTRALITGASGFAGSHLVRLCQAEGDEVVTVSKSATNLLDVEDVAACVRSERPSVVYHLAALAHVGESWQEPQRTLIDNVRMTHNLLEAVRLEAPSATVVVVSSGEVYGPPAELPVDELAPLRPQNPYALSKANADLLAGFYCDAHGLKIIRARAFNHAGPGQQPRYVLSAFARQIALEASRSNAGDSVQIVTGNPNSRRDFTDVRDVVRAYRMLAQHAEPGVYNVCTGNSASPFELLQMLGRAANRKVENMVDPSLLRDHEVQEIRGSHAKLTAATGWKPEITLEETVANTLSWWSEELAIEAAPTTLQT